MARRPSKKTTDPELRLIEAAMTLAARCHWRKITMSDIAQESSLPVEEALMIFRSKHLILESYSKRVDQAVLNDVLADPEIDDSPKDRLFDLLMRRFEAMQKYKIGLSSIVADINSDPCTSLQQLKTIRNSMELTLEAAGISSSGPRGKFRVHGLIAIYAYCLSVWTRDESTDLATTMAAVDRSMSLAEKVGKRLQ